MKAIQLNVDVAQAILNYLVTRPYAEVVGFVHALKTAQPVTPPIEVVEEPKEQEKS